MANRIEILVEVDPTGRGSAKIKGIGREVEDLERKSTQAGARGGAALSGLLGGLGVPLTAGASLLVARELIQTANEGENAQRRLGASAKEAGISFTVARGEAGKLAEELALSQTQAEGAEAKLIQLARVSGRLLDLPEIRKKFADLAAAYGMTSGEIETLTNQLLSGQDEALNRLGIADPSKLYQEYAKSIGKASTELTQQEQAQARLNAVLEKGAQHLGAANERLTTAAGKWAELGAKIDNAKRAAGEFLGERGLALIKYLTPGYDFQKDVDREFIAKGAEDRRIRAEAQAASDAKFKRLNIQDELNKAFNESSKTGDTSAYDAVVFKDFEHLAVARGEAGAKALKDSFTGRLSSLFKEGTPDATVVRFAEAEFKKLRGILSEDEAKKFDKEFREYFAKLSKEAGSYLKGIRGEAEKLFSELAERYAGENDNPFTKIFVKAKEDADKLRKTFGVLGEETVKELQAIRDAHTKQTTLATQLDVELQAASLRRKALAEEEAASIKELTRLDEARLKVIDAQISAAREIPELEAKALALRTGSADKDGLKIDKARVQGEEFRRLSDELSAVSALPGEVGRKAVENVNRELVALFNDLPPDLQAAIAKGRAPGRDTFASAFESEATARRRRVAEEQAGVDRAAREQAGDAALSKEQRAALARARDAGLDQGQVDKRLLGLTGDNLSRDRAGAGEREADRLLTTQAAARAAVEKSTAKTEELTTAVDNLARTMQDPKNRELLIEIVNRSKAELKEDLYGGLTPAAASSKTR